jgi:hypothetical protein
LDLDDFTGRCGQGKHPLLKIIHAELQDSRNTEVEGKNQTKISTIYKLILSKFLQHLVHHPSKISNLKSLNKKKMM